MILIFHLVRCEKHVIPMGKLLQDHNLFFIQDTYVNLATLGENFFRQDIHCLSPTKTESTNSSEQSKLGHA